MSASEKLRALDGRLPAANANPAVRELANALPQLMAVVEMEQEFMDECEQECLARDTSWPPLAARDDIVARKYRALVDLDEALS